jgi:hypothetical protein
MKTFNQQFKKDLEEATKPLLAKKQELLKQQQDMEKKGTTSDAEKVELEELKRQIKVISAHGRMTAAILCGLPPFVAFAQMVIAPDKFTVLLTDSLGINMLIAAGCLQGLGMFAIKKIVDIKV